nr:wax ester/triacylglycerol synthase domain-containing protein [Rhodococcus sp. (in: high G+C Gram-positive bacteria)]
MVKLDVKDAAYHFLRAEAGSLDMYGIYAFDSGDGRAPSFTEIRSHIQVRAALVPALNIVLEEAVLNLDYPSWVPSGGISDEHISDHDLPGASWDACQRLVGTFLETGLDARIRPWHVHVVRGVRGVPTVTGEATIVVFQVTHALSDGLGLTRLAGALFASAAAPPDVVGAQLPGHAPAQRPRFRGLRALAALASVPVGLARYRYEAVAARRRYLASRVGIPAAAQPGTPTRLTAAPTGKRVVHIVPLPASTLRGLGVSVTSAALSAVASVTNQYLDAHGDPAPRVLGASVPIALGPDVEWPSANRVLSGTVDLDATEADPLVRARAIAVSLNAERARVTSPELIALARAEEQLPAPAVLLNRWMHNLRTPPLPTTVFAHTTVVSVDRGPAALELCGSTVAFTSGTPILGKDRSVVHGFFGVGDVITVVILACPDTVPDHDFYRDLLLTALDEMTRAAG